MQKNARNKARKAKNQPAPQIPQTPQVPQLPQGLQLSVPMPELLLGELHQVVTRLGLLALQGLLLREVEEICGPRYGRERGDERPARSGTAPGSLALGGRRVEVRRPRVRQEGHEVPLTTWEALSSEDPLQHRAVEQMLIGVSTRKYRRSLEDMPEGVTERGTSRSAVSRRFVAATGKKLDEWMHRDLSALKLASIMIDGIHVEEHVVLVASSWVVGMNMSGWWFSPRYGWWLVEATTLLRQGADDAGDHGPLRPLGPADGDDGRSGHGRRPLPAPPARPRAQRRRPAGVAAADDVGAAAALGDRPAPQEADG